LLGTFIRALQRKIVQQFNRFRPQLRLIWTTEAKCKQIEATLHSVQMLQLELTKEKELSAYKDQFAAMISHEIRNFLSVIVSSISMIQKYQDRMTAEKQMAYLNTIETQVKHLTHLLNDLLLISRVESVGLEFHPTPVNLHDFFYELMIEAQSIIGEAHQLDYQPLLEHRAALLDLKLMRQIVSNLLSNAAKYSPPGARIGLEVTYDTAAETLHIRVQDAGIGIPKEDQARLFEAFHRASNVGHIAGTGLGLAIVKRAVDAYDGTITFESEVGQGTTFTVTLPMIYNPP
jgi:chemotaxis family two-component system sensor kinase Cph1